MFLVLGTMWNIKNSREIIGHIYEVSPSYTEVLEIEENPYSDEPYHYLRKGQKFFHNFNEFVKNRAILRDTAQRGGFGKVKKGALYGECNRTVCTNEAHYEHRDLVGKHYCLPCAKKINQLCGENVVPLPFHLGSNVVLRGDE